MRRVTGAIVFLLLLVVGRSVSASTILLDVNPSLVTQPPLVGPYQLDFSFGDQLNGIVLEGQSISLDFIFEDDMVARILIDDGGSHGLLSLQTNAGTFPGVFGAASTGYLLDAEGAPLHGPAPIGRAHSNSGASSISVFPGPLGDFHMSGVHYDLVLPSTGHVVTGGHIRMVAHSRYTSVQFGTLIQLPDEASTFGLLGVSLLLCAVVVRFRT